MKIDKINRELKKYQPLIQSIGILVVIIALFIAFWQGLVMKSQIKLTQEEIVKNSQPLWRARINWDKNNSLFDEFEFTALNNEYNIQKIRVSVTDDSEIYTYYFYKNNFTNNSIKEIISNTINKYEEPTIQGPYYYQNVDEESYPIAVTVYYELFGITNDTTILYNYQYKKYHTDNAFKLKSLGLEFIKYIHSDLEKIKKELITYNIDHSYFSYFSNAETIFQDNAIKKNKSLNFVYEYISINLPIFDNKIILKGKNNRNHTLHIMYPRYIQDTNMYKKKIKILELIRDSINSYDTAILSSIQRIEDFSSKFDSISKSTDLEKTMKRSHTIMNPLEINQWKKMNNDLLFYIRKKISY